MGIFYLTNYVPHSNFSPSLFTLGDLIEINTV
jgi:hypothetical protein